MQKSLYAIRHIGFEDLGILYDIFTNIGYKIQYFDAGCDDMKIINRQQPDILVILGGPISSNDTARYPFLKTEIEIIQSRVHLNLPTLGICLGAQIISIAMG